MSGYTSPDGKFVWDGDNWTPIGSEKGESSNSRITDVIEQKILENERIKADIEQQKINFKRQKLIQEQEILNPLIQTLRKKIIDIVDSKSAQKFENGWQKTFESEIFQIENNNPAMPYFMIGFRTKVQRDSSKLRQRTPPPWLRRGTVGPVGAWIELFTFPELKKLDQNYIGMDDNRNMTWNMPHQITSLFSRFDEFNCGLPMNEIVSINYSLEHDMIVYSTKTMGVFIIEGASKKYLEQHTFFHKLNRIYTSDNGMINVARFCESRNEIILCGRKGYAEVYSITAKKIIKTIYVEGDVTSAVFDQINQQYIIGTRYGKVEIYDTNGGLIESARWYSSDEYESGSPILDLLINYDGNLVIYGASEYIDGSISRPYNTGDYNMLPFGSNLYNNGIIDERNSVSVIDEGNFLRPVYPKRLDISYEQIETVLNQINNEINISGLTISMTDYKTFNLLFNPGDRIHRRIQAGLGN